MRHRNRLGWAITLAAAAALIVTACASGYKPPEGYAPFHSDDLRLTVYHPADWSAAYQTEGQNILIQGGGGAVRVSIFRSAGAPTGITSAEALSRGVTSLAEETGGVFEAIEAFDTATGKGAIVRGHVPVSEQLADGQALPDLYLYVLAVATPEGVIFANASAIGEETFAEFKPTLEEIFRSVQAD